MVFLRAVSGESQVGGNPSSGQDDVPGMDSDSCSVGARRGPGGGQRGRGAIAAPQGRCQSLGERTCSGRAEHCSVLASASHLAAWSLDLLPGQVNGCCPPRARSSPLTARQAGPATRRVPLSPRLGLLSFRFSLLSVSIGRDFFPWSCDCMARSLCLLARTVGARVLCAGDWWPEGPALR